MNKSLILTFFLTVSLSLFAQSDNLKNGYIITNQGDTVFGKLDLRTNAINQKQCTFIADNKHKTIYQPSEIAGYFFIDDGKYYVTKTLEIDSTNRTVFAEMLVKGMLNLYYYEDYNTKYEFSAEKNGPYYKNYIPYFFFEDEDGKIMPFKKNPDIIVQNNYLNKDIKYKGLLKYYFANIPAITKQSETTEFTQKDFIKVAKNYHKAICTTGEECIIYSNKKPDTRGDIALFSVFAGIQMSNYILGFYSVSNNFEQTNKSLFSPVLGVQLTLKNPRWTNMLGFQADFTVSQVRTLITHKYNMSTSFNHTRTINSFAPSTHLGLQFIYPKFKVQPNIGGGFAYMYLFDRRKIIKQDNLGIYAYAGVNYKFKKDKSRAIFLRVNYEYYPQNRWVNYGSDTVSLLNAKIGYTF
jgi:hypothetical protein